MMEDWLMVYGYNRSSCIQLIRKNIKHKEWSNKMIAKGDRLKKKLDYLNSKIRNS